MNVLDNLIITHDGSFHADENSACAFLKILFPDIGIIRTRDIDKYPNAKFYVDVGYKYDGIRYFDHHQLDCPIRTYEIPYSSTGLIWLNFGIEIIKIVLNENNIFSNEDFIKKIWEGFEKEFCWYIDAADNGVSIPRNLRGKFFKISHMISSFVPKTYDQKKDYNNQFMEALEINIDIIKKLIINIYERLVNNNDFINTDSDNFKISDIAAGALLNILYPNIGIEAINIVKNSRNDKKFPNREDYGSYSSFGLIWRDYAEKIILAVGINDHIDELITFFDERICLDIDSKAQSFYHKGSVNSINVFKIMELFFDNIEKDNPNFHKYFKYIIKILKRFIHSVYDDIVGVELLEKTIEEYSDKFYFIIKNRHFVIKWELIPTDKLFLIFPGAGETESWRIASVLRSDYYHSGNKIPKIPFPMEWFNESDPSKLAILTGVPDVTFIGKTLGIMGTKSLESAITIVNNMIEKNNVNKNLLLFAS